MTELHFYRIEVAAERSGLPVTRVRSYVRAGLVQPQQVNGRHGFVEDDIARLRKIRRLTADLGVNLAGVDIILRLLDQLSDTRSR